MGEKNSMEKISPKCEEVLEKLRKLIYIAERADGLFYNDSQSEFYHFESLRDEVMTKFQDKAQEITKELGLNAKG